MTGAATVTFGFPGEWSDFQSRHPVFIERFPHLVAVLEKAFVRETSTSMHGRLVFHLSDICKEDFMEILVLAGNAHGIGAEKLLRGMYERAVTARYLAVHPERVEEFIDFGWINLHKAARAMAKIGHEVPDPPAGQAKAKFDEYKKNGRSTDRWSDKTSFREMAESVDPLDKLYAYAYLLPTFQSHPSMQGVVQRVAYDGDAFVFDGGPQREPADRALNFAHLILLDVLELQQRFFGLDLQADLEQLNVDFRESWHGAALPSTNPDT